MGRKDLAKKKSLNPLKVNSSFQIVLVPKNNYFEREMKVIKKNYKVFRSMHSWYRSFFLVMHYLQTVLRAANL